MRSDAGGQTSGEGQIVLLLLEGEEREQLCQRLASLEFGFRFLTVASLTEAWPSLAASQLDALVCDLSAFTALKEACAAAWGESRGKPIIVLVPLGGEERAATLLEEGATDFVIQAGNYPLLLPALLRRSLGRQETSWEKVAMVIRHEINNPLTGVLGNAELILADGANLPEKVCERLTTIIQLAVRLRDVVRNLELRLPPERTLPARSLPAEPSQPLGLTREAMR